MTSADVIRKIMENTAIEVNPERDQAMLDDLIAEQTKQRLSAGSKDLSKWRLFMNTQLRYAAAIIITAVVVWMVAQTAGVPEMASVAWADVVERFKSVQFFSAVVYTKDNATAQPQQYELWMGAGGRARLRFGDQVIFGKKGQVTHAFDIGSLKTELSMDQVDPMAENMLKKLGTFERFSLDEMLRVMFQGAQLQDMTPLINQDASISEDLLIFDAESPISPEWLRIWVLRESRLPVRLRLWDPRFGDCVDVQFTYSKEQSEDFFDADKYSEFLARARSQAVGRTNLAYAYLTDPGGKNYTPAEIFEENGYHLPEVKQVGITEKGAVWIVAGKAQNRTPSGHMFYGFERIEDDLGRHYQRVASSHRTMEDESREVFIPEDYPFDPRRPGIISLICEADDNHPRQKLETIGTVEWEKIEYESSLPANKFSTDEMEFVVQAARGYLKNGDKDRVDQCLEMMKAYPDDSRLGLMREKVVLKRFLEQNEYDEVCQLADRLAPIQMKDYLRWKGYAPSCRDFNELIIAYVQAGHLDKAGALWRQVQQAEPEIPDHLNRRAVEQIRETIRDYLEQNEENLARDLMYITEATINEVGELLGIDLEKKYPGCQSWIPRRKQAVFQSGEQRIKELTTYYQSHSLPEKYELHQRSIPDPIYFARNEIPGTEYSIFPLNGTLESLANTIKIFDPVWSENGITVECDKDIDDKKMNCDLVYHCDISKNEALRYVLDQYGYQIQEVEGEVGEVWVVHYDGRSLQDYHDVIAPVPYNSKDAPKTGMMVSSASNGFSLNGLLSNLSFCYCSSDTEGRIDSTNRLIFVNKTGLDRFSPALSLEIPYMKGAEGWKFAQQWFLAEFGITFELEKIPLKIYRVIKQ